MRRFEVSEAFSRVNQKLDAFHELIQIKAFTTVRHFNFVSRKSLNENAAFCI